jgi:cell division protein ZapA (FtsZ GTPase activity inhibitor)
MTNNNEIDNLTETNSSSDEATKNPPTKYDSPWKDILEIYFKDFIEFFFPVAYNQIDWTKKIEFLDKELQEVTKDAEIGRRYADKLIKVHLKNGKEEWVLVHIEVQSQEEDDFALRMYIYNYRIFDKYKKTVASLAVLGDAKENWRPSSFGYNLFGCSLNFEFPIVKLIDYQQRLTELENSGNPFATVVLAHLAALNTTEDRSERKVQKLALVRSLYEKGFDEQEVINLLAFIDWMLTLPPDIEAEFKLELKQLEAGREMKYVTTFERDARQEGALSIVTQLLNRRDGNVSEAELERIRSLSAEELRALSEELLDSTSSSSKQQEALTMVTRQLNRRLGNIGEDILERIRSLSVEELRVLGEELLDFTSVTDLTNWLSG